MRWSVSTNKSVSYHQPRVQARGEVTQIYNHDIPKCRRSSPAGVASTADALHLDYRLTG